MKYKQESYVTGFVTISVTGHQPELFFQKCIDQKILVWDVKKASKNVCTGNIKLHDLKTIKDIRRGTSYRIRFINKKGLPFLLKRFLYKKEIIYALFLSIILLALLSNILWKVTITGVSKEMEEKINSQLKNYGVHSGSWLFTVDAPSTLQQRLLNDVPELLWVGIDKKGTTYEIEGIEKVTVKKEEVKGPRNIVASKKGVIKSMFISEGVPNAVVNDYVKPGDILVSGVINKNEEDDNKPKQLVAADGIIKAQTWYEISVNIPLRTNFELLTGVQENKYGVRFGNVEFPVWGFGNPSYKNYHKEVSENKLKFLKWNLPISVIKTTLSEKVYHKLDRTKEEAIEIGIHQARSDLQLQLGKDAKILSEKILHESLENGKVNLNLYLTVEEDIAKAEPLTQGD